MSQDTESIFSYRIEFSITPSYYLSIYTQPTLDIYYAIVPRNMGYRL